jgi:carboxyl-terminal processing protease
LNVAHKSRLATDPDLKALQEDLAAIAVLRKEKSVSLNLAKRKAERDRLEADRLTRENVRRAAHGEAPLKDAEALAAAEPPDTVLAEAVRITGDWAALGSSGAAKGTAAKPRLVRVPASGAKKTHVG